MVFQIQILCLLRPDRSRAVDWFSTFIRIIVPSKLGNPVENGTCVDSIINLCGSYLATFVLVSYANSYIQMFLVVLLSPFNHFAFIRQDTSVTQHKPLYSTEYKRAWWRHKKSSFSVTLLSHSINWPALWNWLQNFLRFFIWSGHFLQEMLTLLVLFKTIWLQKLIEKYLQRHRLISRNSKGI